MLHTYLNSCLLLSLILRRIGVVPVAVRPLNHAVLTMDDEFSLLIAADLPTYLFGFLLGVAVDGSSVSPTLLDIPTTAGAGDEVM
jgi:hypothetical protein